MSEAVRKANALAKAIVDYVDKLETVDPNAATEIKRVADVGYPLACLTDHQASLESVDLFRVTPATLDVLCETRMCLREGWIYGNPEPRKTNSALALDMSCECGCCPS